MTVWGARSNLKGSKISLSEDLPPSLLERRKQMARKLKHLGKCNLIQDALYLDGRKYTTLDIDQLPTEVRQTNHYEKKLQKLDGIAFYGANSFLSNFYTCSFSEGSQVFNSAEKYFQYRKALFFNDDTTAKQILRCSTPGKASALSHSIADYDEETFETVARQFMYKACAMKFNQNPKLAEQLKNTKGILIEANAKETFFSCGLKITDPHIEDQHLWKGKNVLGDILCEIRETLLTA